jgi:predicted Zn-dependent peptidase
LNADVTEAAPTRERRGWAEEKFGTLPVMAIGYDAPPRNTADWYAAGILDQALHGGRAGRVHRNLVLERQIAVESGGGVNYPVGDLFDYNGPTLMVTSIFHKPEYSSEATLTAYDEVIQEICENGVTADELEPVKVKFAADYATNLEGGMGAHIPRFGLMHSLACFSLFDNDPSRVNTVLDGFMKVTAEDVRNVARKMLRPANRAVLFRTPASMRDKSAGNANNPAAETATVGASAEINGGSR